MITLTAPTRDKGWPGYRLYKNESAREIGEILIEAAGGAEVMQICYNSLEIKTSNSIKISNSSYAVKGWLDAECDDPGR